MNFEYSGKMSKQALEIAEKIAWESSNEKEAWEKVNMINNDDIFYANEIKENGFFK
jgi:hypothetical protein